MRLITLLVSLSLLGTALANEVRARQWTSWQPTTTQWIAPSSSWSSVWVGTSTSTVYLTVTQQANVVVTITSYIPCVVTSTSWVYQYQGYTSYSQPSPPVGGATVTITSYTEVSGAVSLITRTVTSGSYVLQIIEAASAGSGAAGQLNRAPSTSPISMYWLSILTVLTVLCLMIWL